MAGWCFSHVCIQVAVDGISAWDGLGMKEINAKGRYVTTRFQLADTRPRQVELSHQV